MRPELIEKLNQLLEYSFKNEQRHFEESYCDEVDETREDEFFEVVESEDYSKLIKFMEENDLEQTHIYLNILFIVNELNQEK